MEHRDTGGPPPRERTQEGAVVFTSGYSEDEVVRRGVAESQMRFIHKPFGTEERALAIRAALDEVPVAS